MVPRETKPEGETRESKQDAGNDDAGSLDGADVGGTETASRPKEIGGRKGPDPTRYGDWEKGGRCIDF